MSERKEGYYHIQIDEGVWECGFWNNYFKAWEFGGLEYKDHSIFRVGPRIPDPDEDWVTEPKYAFDEILIQDNKQMRKIGCELAEAALYVAREYDGVHRLMVAVSKWSNIVANEGGSYDLYQEKMSNDGNHKENMQ